MQGSGQPVKYPAEVEDPQIRGGPQNEQAAMLAFWCKSHRTNGATAGAL
jgi:hypothetical protein